MLLESGKKKFSIHFVQSLKLCFFHDPGVVDKSGNFDLKVYPI